MNHEEIRHKLSEFIDGAIAPEERAAIEQHLKTCTECADALRELRKTIEHIHGVEMVESPAWMTQKIMAKVREEQVAKNSLWQRFFVPFFTMFPVQAVAVLFLAVTAYYVYINIDPAQKYTDEPVGMLAKKEAPAAGRMKEEDKTIRKAAPEAKQDSGRPGYKSLDMKYEYEKPAAPVPQEKPAASAPASAKRADQAMTASEVGSKDTRALTSKSAAPMMAEQAAPSAGAGRPAEAKRKTASKDSTAKNALSANSEADAQLDITEHFVKFDLPAKMKIKGLTYRTRNFEKNIADLRWMQETSAFNATPCTSRYVVDVDLSGKVSKYLYCYDRSRITLIGVYELKESAWFEIKR